MPATGTHGSQPRTQGHAQEDGPDLGEFGARSCSAHRTGSAHCRIGAGGGPRPQSLALFDVAEQPQAAGNSKKAEVPGTAPQPRRSAMSIDNEFGDGRWRQAMSIAPKRPSSWPRRNPKLIPSASWN